MYVIQYKYQDFINIPIIYCHVALYPKCQKLKRTIISFTHNSVVKCVCFSLTCPIYVLVWPKYLVLAKILKWDHILRSQLLLSVQFFSSFPYIPMLLLLAWPFRLVSPCEFPAGQPDLLHVSSGFPRL